MRSATSTPKGIKPVNLQWIPVVMDPCGCEVTSKLGLPTVGSIRVSTAPPA